MRYEWIVERGIWREKQHKRVLKPIEKPLKV